MDKTLFVTKSVTQSSDKDLEGVGSIRWVGDNCYRWVKNDEASVALTVGQPVCHVASEKSDLTKSVKLPLTANLGLLAGIVASTSIAAGHFGWIQIFGVHNSVIVTATTNVAVAAGGSLKGVNGQAYLTLDKAMGTAPSHKNTVLALEAVATMTTPATSAIAGFVSCL